MLESTPLGQNVSYIYEKEVISTVLKSPFVESRSLFANFSTAVTFNDMSIAGSALALF